MRYKGEGTEQTRVCTSSHKHVYLYTTSSHKHVYLYTTCGAMSCMAGTHCPSWSSASHPMPLAIPGPRTHLPCRLAREYFDSTLSAEGAQCEQRERPHHCALKCSLIMICLCCLTTTLCMVSSMLPHVMLISAGVYDAAMLVPF